MAESVRFSKTASVVSFVILLFHVVTSSTNTPVIVPADAGVGYSILKLDCDNSDLQLRTKDVFGDFYENFVMTESGDLVLRRPVSPLGGQSYQLTVLSHRNCYDNVPKKRTFDIRIRSTSEVFPQRLYTGYTGTTDILGSLVTHLSNIQVRPEPQQEFVLQGFYSDYFTILPSDFNDQIRVVLNKEFPIDFPKRAFYFTLLSKVGDDVRGHTGIEILRVENPNQKQTQSRSVSNNNPGSPRLTATFDQDLSNSASSHALRLRRQASATTSQQTVEVYEDTKGGAEIFSVERSQVAGDNIRFEIRSSEPEDVFSIDVDTGKVSLKSNAKLDYDYGGVQQYVITVDVKRQDDGTGT